MERDHVRTTTVLVSHEKLGAPRQCHPKHAGHLVDPTTLGKAQLWSWY
jgi:hypothetical protein